MSDEQVTVGEMIMLPAADKLAGWRGFASEIDTAIRAAVLAERQACAKVVPQFGEDPDQEECALWLNTILENAADAIRRRP